MNPTSSPSDPFTESFQQSTHPPNSTPYSCYPQQSYGAQQTYPQHTYPQQTYPQQTYPQQTYPQQTYPQQTYPQQTYPQHQTYPFTYSTYPTSYPYPPNPRQTLASQFSTNAQQTSALFLSSMHDAMTRFARVSALLEDVLRHIHMLFDAVFGLAYSVGALRHELGGWLACKHGPTAAIVRLLRRLGGGGLWRVLYLVLLSPVAGRFSPVALVLRILGLVPEEVEEVEGERAQGRGEGRWEEGVERDSSNM